MPNNHNPQRPVSNPAHKRLWFRVDQQHGLVLPSIQLMLQRQWHHHDLLSFPDPHFSVHNGSGTLGSSSQRHWLQRSVAWQRGRLHGELLLPFLSCLIPTSTIMMMALRPFSFMHAGVTWDLRSNPYNPMSPTSVFTFMQPYGMVDYPCLTSLHSSCLTCPFPSLMVHRPLSRLPRHAPNDPFTLEDSIPFRAARQLHPFL